MRVVMNRTPREPGGYRAFLRVANEAAENARLIGGGAVHSEPPNPCLKGKYWELKLFVMASIG